MSKSMQAFEALSEIISTATPESVKAALPQLFTQKNLDRESLERRIGAFLEWRKRGSFELVNVEKSAKQRLELEIRFPITDDHWRLHVVLAEDGSGKIEELLMGRAALPILKGGEAAQVIADRFIEYITHLGEQELFSGAVLIGCGDQILGETAVGWANRDFEIPNTTNTRFNLASLTKSWTAIAIAQLIEQQHLSLSSKLCDLVAFDGHTFDDRIEIKHLLSHTSGLGDYFGPKFDETPKSSIRELDDFLRLAKTFDPAFAPGTQWNYSNIGMILLGKIIEKLTGQSYYNAIAQNVLTPAEMSDAFFPHFDRVNPTCAVGYGNQWTINGPIQINSLYSWAVRGGPDGCSYGTVHDVWGFAQALAKNTLISSEMYTTMTSPKPELGSDDYGYGFAVLPDRAVIGHSGGLIGASANLDIINAPKGWTVIILANDLSMRTPVIKARQLIGVTMQERDEALPHLPRAGLTAR